MDDDDSLFGSPPPSPSARGRSPSPALALPGASSGQLFRGSGPSAQNVGTIALPGSHYSEPIAANNAQRKKAHKKPRQSTPRPPPTISFPDPSQPPPSHFLRNQEALLGHAGLIAGLKPSRLPAVHCGASPSNPIVLDDRETQIPSRPSTIGRSNFRHLDSSHLPTPSTQEVVDMLIKLKDIFPVLQSILKLLVSGTATGAQGQGIPAATTGARGWSSQRRISVQPLVKRRKLNRVPAGAVDWDVPYPFLDGEGPEAYRQNWTKDRSRQLIAQLIGLVRVALEKATAKKHLDESARRRRSERNRHPGCPVLTDRQRGGKGANHYRDPCRDVTVSSAPNNTVETLPAGTRDPSVAPTSTPTPASSNTTFNDLLSTLLSVPDPTQCAASSASPQTLAPSQLIGTDQSTNNLLPASHLSSEMADQSLVDSWMNILQTFSTDASITSDMLQPDGNLLDFLSGMNPSADLSTCTSGDISSFSTTNPEGQQSLNFSTLDFNQMGNLDLALDLIANGSTSATTGQVGALADGGFDLSIPCDGPERGDGQSAPLSDTPIDLDKLIGEPQNILTNTEQLPLDINALLDPRLLAMSSPYTSAIQSVPSTGDADSQILSNFLPSPPSTLGPVTPTSADCDVTLPGVVAEGQSHIQGTRRDGPLTLVSMTDVNHGKDLGGGVEIMPADSFTNISRSEEPKKSGSQAVPLNTPVPSSSSTPMTPVPQPPSGIFSVVRLKDWQKPKRKLKKTDVLKKAEERREELRASLEQTKVKLWGITIEHGVLLQLLRIGEEERVAQSSPSGS